VSHLLTEVSVEEALNNIPLPLVIISTETKGGRRAGMTAAWVTQVSWKPPLIGVAIYREWTTLKAILEKGEFAIHLVSPRLADAAVEVFGRMSSAKVDKFEVASHIYGLRVAKGKVVEVPVLVEAPYVIECKLVGYHEIGDHYLVICNPVAAYKGVEEMPVVFYRGKIRFVKNDVVPNLPSA